MTIGNGSVMSPSLWPTAPGDPAAFELKFLLSEAQARAVEERVRATLALDPHADPSLGNAYRTTTLYCDTPEYAVFHRVGSFKRRKFRLRRYGSEGVIFLERKAKWKSRVRKQRSPAGPEELAVLGQQLAARDWPGGWFHRSVQRRQLRPVCRMAYDRVAYMGVNEEGTLRVTFDRNIRGVLAGAWSLDRVEEGLPVLTGQVVCEFKFRATLPTLFKEIIGDLALTPSSVSKYRSFMRATGLTARREIADA